jgi:hypothetical protein
MKKKILGWIALFLILSALSLWYIGLNNVYTFFKPEILCEELEVNRERMIEIDSRNEGINISICYESFDNKNKIIYNLSDIVSDKSRTEVFRYILQSANELKEHDFERVIFAYNGDKRFYIEGEYFKQLGEEYDWQNSNFTNRTFPSHVKKMDGTSAYEIIMA